MSRSKWKGPYVDLDYLKTIQEKKRFSRSSTVLPIFVGRTFEVHNGQKWTSLKVTTSMVGYKFGEFVLTRKLSKYRK